MAIVHVPGGVSVTDVEDKRKRRVQIDMVVLNERVAEFIEVVVRCLQDQAGNAKATEAPDRRAELTEDK